MTSKNIFQMLILLTALLTGGCDAFGPNGTLSELAATATAAALPQSFLQGGDSSALEQAIAMTQAAAESGAAPEVEQPTDTAVPSATPTNTPEPSTTTATSTTAPPAARTETPVPEPTNTPSATPTSIEEANLDPTATTAGDPPCNAMRFVADVTVPDGSAMQGKQEFYKMWRVQNVGSCIWTRDYAIRYYGGFQLGAPTSTALDVNVAPGQYTNLGLKMFSPAQSGTFRSEWMLVDETGSAFGIGENYDQPFYVEIYVSGGG